MQNTNAVVKVRGNAGSAVPGPLKIAGERSQATHTAVNDTSRLQRALQLTVEPQIFSELLGLRNLYFNHCTNVLEYGPMPNVMAAQPNVRDALC